MQSETSTLVHYTKSSLASGILAMPMAFKSAGLLVGTVGTIIIAIICTHCSYVLVASAHALCKKSGKSALTYADVAEEACRRGPARCQKYDHFARKLVDIGIFSTYFGACSAYAVIIANHLGKVTAFYYEPINIRLYILMLLVPLLLLCYIPSLKYLMPVSAISNLLMAAGLALTSYYLARDLPSVQESELVADISRFPTFFSITIFALQGIGCVMPLANSMKRPSNFLGCWGVLNQGAFIVAVLHIFLGFLGYLQYGDDTLANITLNLPNQEYLAQAVQILIGLSIYGAYGIQFYICFQIMWTNIEHLFKSKATLAKYLLRTTMTVLAVALAIAVPSIGPFISLIGAFFFSITGILIPIVIEIITFWEDGFGYYNWILIKDVVVIITGLLALIVGTKDAILDIIKLYV